MKVKKIVSISIVVIMLFPNVAICSSLDDNWHLDKIKAQAAWVEIANPPQKVKVAVIDTGVAINHPDLQENINKDLSIKVTDLEKPYKKLANLEGFELDDCDYFSSHGTHVAGIIGASNNNVGVTGVAAKDNNLIEMFVIQAAKMNKGVVEVSDKDMINAINYAVEKGAKVINLSIGRPANSINNSADLKLEEAVDNAVSKGVTIVCAAGNNSSSLRDLPSDFNSTIGVISIDKNNNKLPSSNYKDEDISAPGYNINSTVAVSDFGYSKYSGTSMAAPIVTGVVAMMYAVNPDITPAEVKKIIKETAVDIGAIGEDIYTGAGLIDAKAAVTKAKPNKSNYKLITPSKTLLKNIPSSGIVKYIEITKDNTNFIEDITKLEGISKRDKIYIYKESKGKLTKIIKSPFLVDSQNQIKYSVKDNERYIVSKRPAKNAVNDVNKVTFIRSSKSKTAIRIRWKDDNTADGYIVYRATSYKGKYKRIVKLSNKGKKEYRNANLKSGKRYYFKVCSYVANRRNDKNVYIKKYTKAKRHTTKK